MPITAISAPLVKDMKSDPLHNEYKFKNVYLRMHIHFPYFSEALFSKPLPRRRQLVFLLQDQPSKQNELKCDRLINAKSLSVKKY